MNTFEFKTTGGELYEVEDCGCGSTRLEYEWTRTTTRVGVRRTLGYDGLGNSTSVTDKDFSFNCPDCKKPMRSKLLIQPHK